MDENFYENNNNENNEYVVYEERKPENNGRHKKGGWFFKTIAIALVFGLVSSGVFVGVIKATKSDAVISNVSNAVTSYTSETISADYEGIKIASDVADIVDATMPTVVAITNVSEREVQTWFWGPRKEQVPSAGSGVIIAKDNNYIYIVTNNHVVEGNIVELTVTFCDGSVVNAEVKGTNASMDLAIVRVRLSDISSKTLSEIKLAVLGNSEDT
ncbi:MAG: trypsin-like peptidase domain-containing protein, partial [Lachnospiraceae bacterium]|nr:trypsin-like peptidase domain-containing protein [Lachnospiraceae bacterium]